MGTKGTTTSDIVRHLQSSVRSYYRRHPKEWEPALKYDVFMSQIRPYWLNVNNGSYGKLLSDMSFIEELIKILRAFEMDQRGSRLTSPGLFRDCTAESGQDFDFLSSANIRLETLNLKRRIGNEDVNSIIRRIYNLFSRSYPLSESALSLSGGIVVASKTMHMIMPELFIMIDSLVMKTLHEVSDYDPHPEDGENWYDVIPNYSGCKLNPYSGGSWDYDERYVAALMYYKRIIREWCQQNNTDITGFLNLDMRSIKIDVVRGTTIEARSSAARIIDKALR